MDSLRVTARLRSNIICDRWIPLDGIILSQACREAWGPQDAALPGGQMLEWPPLPLEIRQADTPFWYYACSWAQPQPWWVQESKDHWNKRFDVGFAEMVDFDRRQGRVVIEKGRYKAYHMPIFYYVADVIEWYCVGDGAEIERLLSTCAYIGKKAAQGWGRVIEWRVEAWPEDWSERREGSLTRGLPAGTMPAMDMGAVVYGIRPPYYLKENQTMVMFPDG